MILVILSSPHLLNIQLNLHSAEIQISWRLYLSTLGLIKMVWHLNAEYDPGKLFQTRRNDCLKDNST